MVLEALKSLSQCYLHVSCEWRSRSLPTLRIWTGNIDETPAYEPLQGGDDNLTKAAKQRQIDLESSGKHEEDKYLLSTQEEGASSQQQTKPVYFPSVPREPTRLHLRLQYGFLLSLFGVLAVALVLWAYLVFSKEAVPKENSHKPSDDYVLDPLWKFDEAPQQRPYEWTVSDEILNPDGIFRPMIVVNGRFPGPLIECNEGDTLHVTVHNKASNATSIHFHGMYQNSTNYMDGTVGVTGCPIAPGQSFTYEFKIQGQSGTYWYHAHQGLQAADGLVGPLIVHARDEKQKHPLSYQSDRVLMIHDHYHDLSGSLLMQYLQPDQENAEPVPDSALLNGRNSRDCDDLPDRRCDNGTAQVPDIKLGPTGSHRLRIINVGTMAEFELQVDEHTFAVTEVDGTEVNPMYYHTLRINPAQRYSIILTRGEEQMAPSYWLRGKMVTSCFAEKNPHLDPRVNAVIRYDDSTDQLPTSKSWSDQQVMECIDMNTTELIPTNIIPAPPTADAFIYLRSNFEIGAWRLSRGFFNTTSWRPNVQSPLLSRAVAGLSANDSSLSQTSSGTITPSWLDLDREFVVQTTGIQTVDIVIQNFDDGNHPFHLHGYKFFVLATGRGHFNGTDVYSSLDLSNPLRRDTANVEAYAWLLIRFVADNAGAWALHCHNAWHSEAGLLMTFLTRADVVSGWTLPDSSAELCGAQGLEKGMGPDDHIWYGNNGG